MPDQARKRAVHKLRAAADGAGNPAAEVKVVAGDVAVLLAHLERLEQENRSLRSATIFCSDAA